MRGIVRGLTVLAFLFLIGTGVFAEGGLGEMEGKGLGYMPPNVNGEYGHEVDNLYLTLYYVIAFTFFLTEILLILFAIKYRKREGHRATYSHGNMKAELVWTVIPGIILVWLAFAQSGTWNDIKVKFPKDAEAGAVIQVMPQQFNWNYRYKYADEAWGVGEGMSPDECENLTTLDQVHVPFGQKVLCKMTSMDVIHSFFVPLARVKQDVVPGMMTKVWFQIDLYPVWNLQTSKLEYWTAEDVDSKGVAVGGVLYKANRGKRDYVFVPGERDRFGVPQGSKYDLLKDEMVIYKGGELSKLPKDQVTHVLHYYEVACAELCGLGHYGMDSKLYVHPPELFKKWKEEVYNQGPTTDIEKWARHWDAVRSHYNIEEN